MRYTILILFLSIGVLACAQNWALINPTYKYNYSNDGTDTISNQVFVTHVDTLGVDSFRYELNKIAVQCDTCSIGNWTVLMRLDEPQFMGGQISISQSGWHFDNGLSYLILPEATEGSTWLLDTANGVWAEMGPTEIGTTLDPLEQRRTILLSDGGSIVIGMDHGILHWLTNYDLLGINGLSLGATIPGMEELFPYAVGDVLEYQYGVGRCDSGFGCCGETHKYKFTVGSVGDQQDSSIVFEGSTVRWTQFHYQNGVQNPTTYITSHGIGTNPWTAGIPTFPWPELMFSYPGQLIQTSRLVPHEETGPFACFDVPLPMVCIAEHGINENGQYIIGCRNLGEGFFVHGYSPQLLPNGYTEFSGPVDYFPGTTEPGWGVRYAAGIGFEWFRGSYFEQWEEYQLVGAVLGGDTIGTLTPDGILLSINEDQKTASTPYPNPANDQLTIDGISQGTDYLIILDAIGHTCRSNPVSTQDRVTVYVSDLSPGLYFLQVGSSSIPQRFIIAR